MKEDLLWRHHEPWPNGYYRVNEATCDGSVGCAIGKPRKSCVKNGTYIKGECACYYLTPLNEYQWLTIDEVFQLMNME